ncbi:hypothetical protein [Chlorogloeopsis sp. ULAP02]|uniref:hypothetical protein n=1 Tax=Chlorogloeopsis sp. ULAP02 TaxID=3107926 RepID=UPI003135B00D
MIASIIQRKQKTGVEYRVRSLNYEHLQVTFPPNIFSLAIKLTPSQITFQQLVCIGVVMW